MTRNAGSWAIRLALFFAIGALLVLVQVDRHARIKPGLASMLPEGLGGFADERIVEQLAVEDPERALRRADALLRHRPTDAHHLGLFALASVEAGQSEQAGEALSLASQRGWRDSYTQVSVAGSALAQGQYEIAAQRIDALARLRNEQGTLFAAIRYMLDEPDGRMELARRLVVSAPLSSALSEFTRANEDMGGEVAAVLAATHATGNGISCANYSRTVRALLAQSQGAAALRAWPSRCGGSAEGGALAFSYSSDDTDPFAWTYPAAGGISIDDGEKRGTIDIRNRDLLRRTVAYRYVVLEPGRYEIAIARSAPQGRAALGSNRQADLSVLLRCDRRGGEASGALVNGAIDEAASFDVGEDCPIQYLALSASQGRADDVRIRIER